MTTLLPCQDRGWSTDTHGGSHPQILTEYWRGGTGGCRGWPLSVEWWWVTLTSRIGGLLSNPFWIMSDLSSDPRWCTKHDRTTPPPMCRNTINRPHLTNNRFSKDGTLRREKDRETHVSSPKVTPNKRNRYLQGKRSNGRRLRYSDLGTYFFFWTSWVATRGIRSSRIDQTEEERLKTSEKYKQKIYYRSLPFLFSYRMRSSLLLFI